MVSKVPFARIDHGYHPITRTPRLQPVLLAHPPAWTRPAHDLELNFTCGHLRGAAVRESPSAEHGARGVTSDSRASVTAMRPRQSRRTPKGPTHEIHRRRSDSTLQEFNESEFEAESNQRTGPERCSRGPVRCEERQCRCVLAC